MEEGMQRKRKRQRKRWRRRRGEEKDRRKVTGTPLTGRWFEGTK